MSLLDLDEEEEKNPVEDTPSNPKNGPVPAKHQVHSVKDAGSESESEEFPSPLHTTRSKRGPQRVQSDNEEDGDTDFANPSSAALSRQLETGLATGVAAEQVRPDSSAQPSHRHSTPDAEPAPPRSKRQRTEAGRPSKAHTRPAAAQTKQQGNSAAMAALGMPAPRRAGLRDKKAGLNVRERLIANQRRMLDGTPGSAPASATSSGQGTQAEETETDEDSIISRDDASQSGAEPWREALMEIGIMRHGEPEKQFEQYIRFQAQCLLDPDGMEEVVQSNQKTMMYFREVCRRVEDRVTQCRDKCVESEAWRGALKGFIPALVSRPFSRIGDLTDQRDETHYGCAACNRNKAHANCLMTFFGDCYEPDFGSGRQLTESDNQGANRPDWLQDYGGGAYNGDAADAEQDRAEAEESRSEDSKVCQRGLQGVQKFAVGRHCAARVRLYHCLLHWKRHLQDGLGRRLEELSSVDDQPVLAQQPDGDEREYPALRRLMTDNRFIKEQFTYYTKLQGLAERYLRETNDGSWARNAQHLANEIHTVLDTVAAPDDDNNWLVITATGSVGLASPVRRRIRGHGTPRRAPAAGRVARRHAAAGTPPSAGRSLDQRDITDMLPTRPPRPSGARRKDPTSGKKQPLRQSTLLLAPTQARSTAPAAGPSRQPDGVQTRSRTGPGCAGSVPRNGGSAAQIAQLYLELGHALHVCNAAAVNGDDVSESRGVCLTRMDQIGSRL